MKKTLVMGIIAGSLCVFMGTTAVFSKNAPASDPGGDVKEPVVKQPSRETAVPKKAFPPASVIEKKKAELNGAEWTVEMRPMTGKGKPETDVITFSDGKVSSKKLSGLGYEASNFTVRLEEDGTVIWETMQVSEKDGTAFWRGDVKDGAMRGVLSKRDKKNNPVDFNFRSIQSAPVPQAAAKPSPAAATTTTTGK